jgi:hypothetical protein
MVAFFGIPYPLVSVSRDRKSAGNAVTKIIGNSKKIGKL